MSYWKMLQIRVKDFLRPIFWYKQLFEQSVILGELDKNLPTDCVK